jgi:hypothetical protein
MLEFLKGFWYGWTSEVAASVTKPERKEGMISYVEMQRAK